MKYTIFLLSLIYILAGYAYVSRAQSITGASAIIHTNPKYPSFETTVEATLETFSADLKKSTITWTRNGSVGVQGIGVSSFRFKTGAIGTTERLVATVKTPDGKEITAEKNFLLGDVDLLWRAATTIPPEYKGKALPSPFSSITVAAIPHFSKGGVASIAGDLVFDWFVGGKRDANASGIGKSSFEIIAGASPAIYQVSVMVRNEIKNISFEKSVAIRVFEPEVLLHEERPLEGPFMGKALSQITLNANDTKIFRATPYFFPKEHASSLAYEWLLNDEQKNTPTPHLFGFSPKASNKNPATLGISITNTVHAIQKALAKLIINVQ